MPADNIDRRALIVGSWLAQGRIQPTHQRVRGLLDRWSKALGKNGRVPFGSLGDKKAEPIVMTNPGRGEVLNAIMEGRGLTARTELLLYFVGHSVSSGAHGIELILQTDEAGENRTLNLDYLVRTIVEAGIGKFVLILDTCHSGRAVPLLEPHRGNVFAMFAAGSEYAFDANFSECLLQTLERPIRRNDQRIDRSVSGITYQKVFEDARGRLLRMNEKAAYFQQPESFGDHGSTVLHPVSVAVSDHYNSLAPPRSVYARLLAIMSMVASHKPTPVELGHLVRRSRTFLLSTDERLEEGGRYLSAERLEEYLDFLRRAKWLVSPQGRYQLTAAGSEALHLDHFNRLLLRAIEQEILPDYMSFETLDEIVKDLLKDMLPSTPSKIQQRAAMKGLIMNLDAATKVAIQLLPMAGRFLKVSADAIYPAEYGPA